MSGDDARREAARVLAEASNNKRTKINDTAAHVLKGAIVRVLGDQCATTTQLLFGSTAKGTLTVSYKAAEKPTDAQLREIEIAALATIQANAAVAITQCTRSQAAERFGASVFDDVNSTSACTAEDAEQVSIVQIDGCPPNCCKGVHLDSVAELKGVRVLKIKHRAKNAQLDFDYVAEELTEVPASSSTPAAAGSKKAVKKAAPSSAVSVSTAQTPVQLCAREIMQEFGAVGNADVEARVGAILMRLQNAAYTDGFFAGQTPIRRKILE